jgi:hypothetical protein
MRKQFALVGLAAGVLMALTASSAVAAPIVQQFHFTSSDTFPDELCGISGTSTTNFVGNFKLFADGTFLSTSNFRQVFTADSTGKQVLISGVEQVTGPFNPTNNGDGTITQTFTFKGLPVKLSIANGPTLVRDAGNVTVAVTFLINPDGSRGDFVSQTVLAEKGPHPSLDNGELFCDAIVPALS